MFVCDVKSMFISNRKENKYLLELKYKKDIEILIYVCFIIKECV